APFPLEQPSGIVSCVHHRRSRNRLRLIPEEKTLRRTRHFRRRNPHRVSIGHAIRISLHYFRPGTWSPSAIVADVVLPRLDGQQSPVAISTRSFHKLRDHLHRIRPLSWLPYPDPTARGLLGKSQEGTKRRTLFSRCIIHFGRIFSLVLLWL